MLKVSGILIELVAETPPWLLLAFRSSQSLQAENLFLRRQLALYVERGVKPQRIDPATRIRSHSAVATVQLNHVFTSVAELPMLRTCLV